MKHCFDKSFKYTPVADQEQDYLRKKFERLIREQRKSAEEAKAKVQNFPRRINGSR